MTYPPDDHLMRDLGLVSWLDPDGCAHAELAVESRLLDASGAVSLGAIGTAVDVACARAAFPAAHPHWIATASLSLTLAQPVTDGTVQVSATPAFSDETLITLDVDGGSAGTGAATFVRIPRSASLVENDMTTTTGERSSMPRLVDPPDSIVDRLGFRVDGGDVELEPTDYCANSFGTITGGALVYLVARAAEEATGLVAADLMLRYIGQVKVGPARAVAAVVRTGTDHAVSDVVVRDAGDDGRLLARATVTSVRR